MEVNSLYTEQNTAPTIETGKPGGAMGKDQFMQLLVAQMKNQDPTKPVDNAQLTAQLAQFSALEQMENLNGQFEGFQQNTVSAMSLMNSGKPVVLELLEGGKPIEGTLEKVMWNGGETQFVVDGKTYFASNVKSLTAGATEAPSESIEEKTAAI